MIEITEYLGRLQQGYTQAFLCRGDDGHLYVVKSRLSGKASLIREWLCGCIGRELSLPVPPFELAYAQPRLFQHSEIGEMSALADVPGFASRFVTAPGGHAGLPTLNVSDVPRIRLDLRRQILLFDWWVLNVDRADDNPNLLWDPLAGELHVIDHNLAFDRDAPTAFWSSHIFRADREGLCESDFRNHASSQMERILERTSEFWSDIPDEWKEASDLSLAEVDTILGQYRSDGFWSIP